MLYLKLALYLLSFIVLLTSFVVFAQALAKWVMVQLALKDLSKSSVLDLLILLFLLGAISFLLIALLVYTIPHTIGL